MKRNLVGKILGKIKIFVQDFVPIRTALNAMIFRFRSLFASLFAAAYSRGEDGPLHTAFSAHFDIFFDGGVLKKNQNTPRPSEHPPVIGEKMSKRLGGIKRLQIQNLFMAFKQVPRCR